MEFIVLLDLLHSLTLEFKLKSLGYEFLKMFYKMGS